MDKLIQIIDNKRKDQECTLADDYSALMHHILDNIINNF